jgi:hypothetical protein
MYSDPSVYRWEKCPKRFLKSIAILTALSSFGLPAHSLDIYQWVDELGKTHMGDVVPEKYKAKAKLLNYRRDNISDADRRSAEAKVANSKVLLKPQQTDAPTQPTITHTPEPAEPAQSLSCTQKWDAYYRSQECFAPYLVRNGMGGSTIKPEAYVHCREVKSPTMECEYDKRPSKN